MPSPRSLLLAAAAFLIPLLSVNDVHALQAMGPPPVRRADHVDLAARLIKKRGPAPAPTAVVKRQTIVPTVSQSTPTPVTNSNTNTNTRLSSTASITRTQGPFESIFSSIFGTATTTGVSRTSSVSSSTAISSTLSSTSTSASSTTSSASPTTRSTNPASTVVAVETAFEVPTESSKPEEGPSALPKPVLIGLIVAGSCIVGIAAIWTIIRKWKFSPSRNFEDRLDPITWDPTGTTGLPSTLARGNSMSSHHTNGSLTLADQARRDMTGINEQPASVAPDFPPHDFTAGAAHLAPVNGYADLQRGPSPGPAQFSQPYGQYDTPNPYDYNSGYGQGRQY